MIDTCRRRKLRLLYELCWIAFPIALCPLLVTFVTWQRASPRRATRATILELGCVANGLVSGEIESQRIQGNQAALRRGGTITDGSLCHEAKPTIYCRGHSKERHRPFQQELEICTVCSKISPG